MGRLYEVRQLNLPKMHKFLNEAADKNGVEINSSKYGFGKILQPNTLNTNLIQAYTYDNVSKDRLIMGAREDNKNVKLHPSLLSDDSLMSEIKNYFSRVTSTLTSIFM